MGLAICVGMLAELLEDDPARPHRGQDSRYHEYHVPRHRQGLNQQDP